MKRYRWNILGLCEVRWKNTGETFTPEGHKLFFSGSEDRHEHAVRFLIYIDTVNAIMGYRPVSSRLITIRLKASLFNITIIQAYAPTIDYDKDDIEDFYDQLQEGATRGVKVSMSAFLACHQYCCAGSSLAWDLNLRAAVCGIF